MMEGGQKSEDTAPAPEKTLVAAVGARCLRCGHDLARMPEAARYCPRCGLDTLTSPPASVVAHVAGGPQGHPDVLGGWNHLSNLSESAAEPTDLPEPINPTASSLMVRGYGNALYRLGRRYEIGSGSFPNLREAMRCYTKSARLGNLWALGRLASQLFSSQEHSTKVDGASNTSPHGAEQCRHDNCKPI
jgi:TPR repeat protein